MFWTAFQGTDEKHLTDAVDELISTCKSAPLFPELSAAVQTARNAASARAPGFYGGFAGTLNEAARLNKVASPEYVKECLKLLDLKMSRKISMEQFIQGCDLLDQAADLYNPRTLPIMPPGVSPTWQSRIKD